MTKTCRSASTSHSSAIALSIATTAIVMIGLVATYPASIWALIPLTGAAGAIAWLCRTMSRPWVSGDGLDRDNEPHFEIERAAAAGTPHSGQAGSLLEPAA